MAANEPCRKDTGCSLHDLNARSETRQRLATLLGHVLDDRTCGDHIPQPPCARYPSLNALEFGSIEDAHKRPLETAWLGVA